MVDALSRFQNLLRELFQFDCSDLDFGIYRILNYKRQQIEDFISNRLPKIVDEAFAEYAIGEQELAKELEHVRQEILKAMGKDAFDEDGQLKPAFQETPLGKKYLGLKEKQAKHQVTEELKVRTYNDLYSFFARYYEDGDFITRRRIRYGGREAYAVPYSGEEVILHWATKDQYYVKTAERFKTYRFKVGEFSVAFELRNATIEQNNNRSNNKRYFVLANENPVHWKEDNKTLTIFFEYRPLMEKEEQEYGHTEQQKPQDKLNEAATQKILQFVKENCSSHLLASLSQPVGDKQQSLLLKHLTRFTRKNTADFFIHKDLRGFLLRELDYFIKTEVLLLDELLTGSETDLQRHIRRAQVVRKVAEHIIDFLAQVENFQKRLFEKKKFVVRTEYCLTMDKVPEDLWDEVLKNKKQLDEWQELYGISTNGEAIDKDFIRQHPTLVIDTRHFSDDFKWRLLSRFEDLDDEIDGILIKSENFQALNLLLEKYREKIKCIYIDPPYNTGSDEFVYKDNYQHSCWLSMMADRLALGRELMLEDGVIGVSIDDNEFERLKMLMDRIFGADSFINFVAVKVRESAGESGGGEDKRLKKNIDYLLVYTKSREKFKLPQIFSEIPLMDTDLKGFVYSSVMINPGRRIKITTITDGSGNPMEVFRHEGFKIKSVQSLAKEENTSLREIYLKYHDRIFTTYNARTSIRDRVLRFNEKFISIDYVPRSGKYKGRKMTKFFLGTTKRLVAWLHEVSRIEGNEILLRSPLGTLWDDISWATLPSEGGVKFEAGKKPVDFVKRILQIGDSHSNCIVLDFFAGSGTTAHAVINLNREDGGRRKYILVEMGDWFETVLLPRIKKVVFCEKWKDGKPAGGKGISHFVKYHILEQYEDTLNNLELLREQDGQKALEMLGDEYLLRYMLEFETQGSPSLLNLERFKNPFTYRLKVQEGDEIVERPVDLVETFNYLLGIHVKKVRAFKHNGRSYRAVMGERDGKRIVIVWRCVVGMEDNKEALREDKAFIEQTILPALLDKDSKPDRLFVNAPCYVENAEAIEPEFMRRMFAEVV